MMSAHHRTHALSIATLLTLKAAASHVLQTAALATVPVVPTVLADVVNESLDFLTGCAPRDATGV